MEQLEKYAKENNIPIMMKDGIEFLLDFIVKNNVKSILEIGSAIGYSAIRMASLDKDIKVTTIERDNERYNEAVKNIKKYNLEEQIVIINDDAFNVDLNEKYDLIFIDAAKSQYIKFFEKFKLNLKENGYIVSDNLNFHGLVDSNPSDLSRNVRGLVRKLNNYVEFLKNNTEFKTEFYDLGDGVSISQRKEVFMKKNAFTLVELLGVIVILAAIALIAFPPILNQIKKSQTSIDEATKKLVTSAAALYVDDNTDEFKKNNGNVYCAGFDDLIKSGHLTETMLNGNEDIKEKMLVKISYLNGFSYDVVPANQCEPILKLCSLVSGEAYAVGSKYSCDLGSETRNFYVLESGTNDKPVSLILEGNYDMTTQAWCNQAGQNPSNNACKADGLTAKLDEIHGVWSELDRSQITLPSIQQIETAGNVYIDGPSQLLSNSWLYSYPGNDSWGTPGFVSQNNPHGYWTSTPAGGTTTAYIIGCYGEIHGDWVYDDNQYGVRPVILVEQSDL